MRCTMFYMHRSPTREDAERTLQSQSADDGFVQRQNGTAAFDYQATSRITYSKDELTDIAEVLVLIHMPCQRSMRTLALLLVTSVC